MNLLDRIIAGFKAQLLSKVLTAIAGGVLTATLARLLQPRDYGLFVLAVTVFGSFQIFARLGIPGSAGRYVAEFKETDPEQIPGIIRFSFLLNVDVIGVTALIVVIGYPFITDLLNEPELAQFLAFGAVLLIFGTVQTYLRKVLQGFEEIRAVAVLKAAGSAGRLVFALGFVFAGFGAVGAYAGYVISSALTTIVGAGYLFSRLREYWEDASALQSGLRRRIAEYSVPLIATNSARILDKRIDTLLVGAFLSPVEVGFYVLADRVVRLVEMPMSALGFTLSPMFGSEKASGNIERISRIYETALVNTLLLYIPAAAGIVIVAEPLIRIVFGPAFDGATVVLRVLGVYIILKAVTKLTDNGLNYLGRARDRAIFRTISAVLNVALTVALLPVFGVVGAAIATLISYGLYTAANLYVVSLEFALRSRILLGRLVSITLITVVMSAVVFSLVGYISGWITLFLVVGTGALIWGGLSVLTGLVEPRTLLSTFR